MEESKKFWDGDKVMSVCAIFISLMTLFIFLYQTRLMKDQSRLMVMPRVSFIQSASSTDSSLVFAVSAVNNGLGPAILDSVRILYAGERWPADFENFFENQMPELVDFLDGSTSISDGSMHPQNINKVYFRLVGHDQRMNELIQILQKIESEKKIDILIYYSSIYREKWLISLFSESATPIPLN